MSEYIYGTDDDEGHWLTSEEIVRCRDCVYICHREYRNRLEYHTCNYFDSEYAEVELDGFCAWGERKVVDE